jgi:hypothetical protein
VWLAFAAPVLSLKYLLEMDPDSAFKVRHLKLAIGGHSDRAPDCGARLYGAVGEDIAEIINANTGNANADTITVITSRCATRVNRNHDAAELRQRPSVVYRARSSISRDHKASSNISALSSCLPSLVPSYRALTSSRNAGAKLSAFSYVKSRVTTTSRPLEQLTPSKA